jgi:hypothetical protein
MPRCWPSDLHEYQDCLDDDGMLTDNPAGSDITDTGSLIKMKRPTERSNDQWMAAAVG